MAPTIIRVKRKIDEVHEIDPKIVLNCKKQKVNDKDIYSQFSFIGTVEEKADATPEHILKLSKKEAETIVQNKTKDPNTSLNSRLTENSEKSKEKRFKVVNFLRSTCSSKDLGTETDEQLILDVETETATSDSEKNSYVYDIYLAQDEFTTVLKDDLIDLNDLSILEYNDYLYSCPRLTSEDDPENDEDEDSNDENNWRNDYPDEDEFSDDSSMDEHAIRRAMQTFGLDNELSSDEEEDVYNESKEGFVYSIDAEEYGFDDDYDYANADAPGKSYEKYKKRIMKDLQDDSESSTDSDE